MFFGILRDIVGEVATTAKAIDDSALQSWTTAKDSANDTGVGPESVRDVIGELEKLVNGK